MIDTQSSNRMTLVLYRAILDLLQQDLGNSDRSHRQLYSATVYHDHIHHFGVRNRPDNLNVDLRAFLIPEQLTQFVAISQCLPKPISVSAVVILTTNLASHELCLLQRKPAIFL